MILEHRGTAPTIDPSAYVAPTAVVLDFPGAVYGIERGTPPQELMRRQSEFFGAHREDRECG